MLSCTPVCCCICVWQVGVGPDLVLAEEELAAHWVLGAQGLQLLHLHCARVGERQSWVFAAVLLNCASQWLASALACSARLTTAATSSSLGRELLTMSTSSSTSSAALADPEGAEPPPKKLKKALGATWVRERACVDLLATDLAAPWPDGLATRKVPCRRLLRAPAWQPLKALAPRAMTGRACRSRIRRFRSASQSFHKAMATSAGASTRFLTSGCAVGTGALFLAASLLSVWPKPKQLH